MASTTTFLRQAPATSRLSTRSNQRSRTQLVVQASVPKLPTARPSREVSTSVSTRAAAGAWSTMQPEQMGLQYDSKPASKPAFLSFLPAEVSRTLEEWLVSGLKEEMEEESHRPPMYKSHVAERLATIPRIKGAVSEH